MHAGNSHMIKLYVFSLVSLIIYSSASTAQEEAASAATPPKKPMPTITVGGRIMMDAAAYDSDELDLSSGTEFRRLRLFAKGKVAEDWGYRLQYDFTGEGNEGIRDAYIEYTGFSDIAVLRFGNSSVPGSMEDYGSSKYMTFMERGMPLLAFVPSPRRIGVAADHAGENWSAVAGVYGEDPAVDETEDDSTTVAGRLTCAPVNSEGSAVHLGVFGQYREMGGRDEARFRARPEAHVDDTRLIDSGTISNVNGYATYGVEVAWVGGPFSLQGEYVGLNLDRDTDCSINMDGFYVYGSVFLTGESRAYDASSGLFGRVKPKNIVGEGGVGAWEIGARFSTLDMNDELDRGRADSVTLGMNWYATSRVRFMLNYVNAELEGNETVADADVDVVQLRAQVDF